MPFYLGFDRLTYPGDSVMQSLKASTPLAFVGLYLSPAPNQQYTGWMSKVATLKSMGWGLIPLYVGQQLPGPNLSSTLTAAQGTADASNAVTLAHTADLAAGSVIYLDVGTGGTLPTNFMTYITAWIAGVDGSSFSPGIRCSDSQTEAQISGAVAQSVLFWIFKPVNQGAVTVNANTESAPDPGSSGFAGATVWRYKESLPNAAVTMTWTDTTGTSQTLSPLAMDTSAVPDPSNPTPVTSSQQPDPSSPAPTSQQPRGW
jgi:Domain of unknown function (DUF1906)